MSSSILIRGGCVLTLGTRTPNLERGDVLIDEGRITEVAPSIRTRAGEVVDASNTIVMPGFVDCHRHLSRSLFRNWGSVEDTALLGAQLSPEDLYAATLIGLLGAGQTGITTVADWSERPEPEYLDASHQAHLDSGLGTVLVHTDHPSTPILTNWDDSIRIAYGSADPGQVALEILAQTWTEARQQGKRIHAHLLAEAGLANQLNAQGLLGPDVTLVHCSAIANDDLEAIAQSRSGVALTPASEMARGWGPISVQGFIDRGVRLGLGVDDEMLAPGDMFAQMRAIISLQHATAFELKLAGKPGVPQLLGTRDVIRYATSDGARAIGLSDITGALEPGKRADLITLRTDRPNISPVNDPIGAVVWGMDTSNLDTVVAQGRFVMRDGELLADVDGARKRAGAARDRLTVVASGAAR